MIFVTLVSLFSRWWKYRQKFTNMSSVLFNKFFSPTWYFKFSKLIETKFRPRNGIGPIFIWDKVFEKGSYKICERHTSSKFLKAVFQKFYLVHFWILCPIYCWISLSKNFSNLVHNTVLGNSLVPFQETVYFEGKLCLY